MLPPVETLLAMSSFALAGSATPGPVNIIGAMTGTRYGTVRALPFVTGATVSFLALLLICGTGMLAQAGSILTVARPMTLLGSAYLLWMAWGLARSDGAIGAARARSIPGFWSGVMVQGLNPKAWLVVLSALSTFILPLRDPRGGLMAFVILSGVICWPSLALWAWGGSRVPQGSMRLFNRTMALALLISVGYILWHGL
ncbi:MULTISPECIES: LysE family translocator [unclassified Novosphingobium]|uniref:LysE family translocator n=1 Tax=unclassified Novosphingobium TaxID=2644732 RepID=UPI000AF72A01|nr:MULTISPECIES: LysE family translocator [unclassified Novosphingobium]MDR6707431.1 threonine/homoserine/homoserine lactone efflux protein [Novosphingobium sp. 1748]